MEITFKIRASGASDISARAGLTDKQTEKLQALIARKSGANGAKPLTENMEKELAELLFRKENPELPEGAKTYCENWLKETIWKRRKELKNKYVDKGNRSEEDGFTLLCVERELGMVYKNVEFFSDFWMQGTPDLVHNGVVYDNKCSWDLSTFPMYKKENPDQGYWWQLQVYMALTGCKKAVLAYTLIDADRDLLLQATKHELDPERIYKTLTNMIYTKQAFEEAVKDFCPLATSDYFVEIPDSKRIKTYSFDYDPEAILFLRKRVEECQAYINSLLN
jgi:hypothetical protein